MLYLEGWIAQRNGLPIDSPMGWDCSEWVQGWKDAANHAL